ncbi:MAG: hypothetical protein GKR89_22715 [Candidatus Latescibacteria bacterium]|nr:hypothetical protein [Candidatus Latescibacterota bacterium]
MRRQRTIYFNDARHYYLFVFEPPMRMEDAWRPIDEVAGTGVDTFIYGVSRVDGLFYPSAKGLRFGADLDSFGQAAYWRVWENMQSLIDRGLDPLQVLVDRAHDKGVDFFASLRMGDFPGLDAKHTVPGGGRGYAEEETREHQFGVLEELATRYPVEGVELDFAAAPGGTAYWFKAEEAEAGIPLMTEYVRRISQMVRQRPGTPGQVGARVYPTEALNRRAGLDVGVWLDEGLVDYVVPLVYAYFVLDANMPIDWLVEKAHANDTSVYAMLQPYYTEENRRFHNVTNASPAMMRAAAANYRAMGVDGLYTWFMEWPLGSTQRNTLSELADGELLGEGDKHYFLCRQPAAESAAGYVAHLPVTIGRADLGKPFAIPFAMADDPDNPQVQQMVLRIGVTDLVGADRFEVALNGQSLAGESCRRTSLRQVDPYGGQWLEFYLQKTRPVQGDNVLEVTLRERPAKLLSDVVIEDVELVVQYGTFPAGG